MKKDETKGEYPNYKNVSSYNKISNSDLGIFNLCSEPLKSKNKQ